MPTDPTHTVAPRALWLIARTLISDICNLFGAPQDITRQPFIAARARALMLTWLRAGETVLRHLLLIEAAALLPTLPPPQPSRAASTRTRRTLAADPAAPETWRVCFRAIPAHATHASRSTRVYARPSKDRNSSFLGENYFKDPEQVAAYHARKAAWLAEMNAFAANSRSPALRGGAVAQRATEGALAASAAFYATQPLAHRVEALLRAFNAPAPHARRLAFHLRRAPHHAPRLTRIPADIERALDRGSTTELHTETLTRCPPSWRTDSS